MTRKKSTLTPRERRYPYALVQASCGGRSRTGNWRDLWGWTHGR